MSLIGIHPLEDSDQALAEDISKELSLPVKAPDKTKLSLMVSGAEIFLKLNNDKKSTPFQPDFSSSKAERKIKDELRRRGLLLKAVEGRTKEPLEVFDFYSGFAADAFLLACAGHHVVSCEKNPVISFVTKMAWRRQKDESWVQEMSPDLTLKNADSKELLRNSMKEFDVIYMDPMFEKLKSSAKSPLPMQIVQTLLEGENPTDFAEDFAVASEKAKKIVVKLPLKGKEILKQTPNHQILGQTIRYDVYLM